MSINPLMVTIDEFIDYAAITPKHISTAIPKLIKSARTAVENAADTSLLATWDTVIEPLQDASEPLWRAWSVAGHLNAVVNTPELREAYNECLPLITEFSTWVSLHEGLYEQYKRLAASEEFAKLSKVRQRIITLALRDFRLGGAELKGEQREQYRQISDQQAQASQKFSENVLDSIDNWALYIESESELEGIPNDVKQAALEAAKKENKNGWKLVLQMPCFIPVMQYAKSRDLRHKLYKAYATIASELGDSSLDNSSIIEKLLELRSQEAKLLGYENFANLRLETRMADSSEQVLEFLNELADKSKPHAENDLKELTEFAKQQLGLDNLQPWDVAFASEQLRQNRYAYSEEEVKKYFTEPKVLQGLFEVAQKLFGVKFRQVNASVWHSDVKTFEILNANNKAQGVLYIDLFARQGKQSGAWVGGERDRRKVGNHVQLPIVYLTCNFSPAQAGKPALLTHNDVITLFHESGHALHALLSEVDDPSASAFSAVEWDAIELPSQFMENFCWEWSVIQSMSEHVETKESLPRELYNKLLAAKNFQSGMQMVRQLEFSMFDMSIHGQKYGLSIEQVLQTLSDVREKVAVIFPPQWHRFPHNFSHLFAGGYSAGYYSYKWAEVLSADAYALFEENAEVLSDGTRNTLDPKSGKLFLDEILAVGGTRPAADSFKAFRGREANIDALLRHSGITA